MSKYITARLSICLDSLSDADLNDFYTEVKSEIDYRNQNKTASPTQVERCLVDAGLYIQCIKAVRDRLGLGLKDAKDLVDKWKANGMQPEGGMPSGYSPPTLGSAPVKNW